MVPSHTSSLLVPVRYLVGFFLLFLPSTSANLAIWGQWGLRNPIPAAKWEKKRGFACLSVPNDVLLTTHLLASNY